LKSGEKQEISKRDVIFESGYEKLDISEISSFFQCLLTRFRSEDFTCNEATCLDAYSYIFKLIFLHWASPDLFSVSGRKYCGHERVQALRTFLNFPAVVIFVSCLGRFLFFG
jgi:hypothetical protein